MSDGPKPAAVPAGDVTRDALPIKPGRIVVFYGARGLTRAISLATHSPFYHVAIAAGGSKVIEAIPSGVTCRDVHPGRPRRFLTLPAPDATGPTALAWARTQIGDGYDSRDFLGLVLDRLMPEAHVNVASGDRFTCGEFVAAAFRRAGSILFPDMDDADVVPADFARFIPASIAAEIRRRMSKR